MKKVLFFFLILATALMLMGCTTKTTTSTNLGEEKAQVKAEGGQVYQIVIENFKFNPVDKNINVGDSIEWVNKDSAAHTVSFENGDFEQKLAVGETTIHKFEQAGEFRYFCSLHPGMQGSITVK